MNINYKDIEVSEDWIDIEDLGVYLHSKSYDESPSMEVYESSNAKGRLTYQGVGYTHRDIEVSLLLAEQSSELFRTKLQEITATFSKKLAISFKDNNQLFRDVQLVESIGVERLTHNIYILNLKLKAYDPYRYNFEKELVKSTGIKRSRTVLVSNDGNTKATPIIRLSGKADKIDIKVGDKTTTYINLIRGESIVIDCDKYSVYNNLEDVIESRLSNWRDNFIELQSGVNQVFISGRNMDLDIEIEFRHTFL